MVIQHQLLGHGLVTFSYSANVDYAIQQNGNCRIEARTLNSRDQIFEGSNTRSSNSTWLMTALSLVF